MFKEKKKRIDLNTYISNPNPLEIQVGDSTRIVSSWPNNDISLTYRFSWNLRGYPGSSIGISLLNNYLLGSQVVFSVAPRISPSTRHQWDVSLSRLPPLSDLQGPGSGVKLHATPGVIIFPKDPGSPCQRMIGVYNHPQNGMVFRFHATILRRWLDP